MNQIALVILVIFVQQGLLITGEVPQGTENSCKKQKNSQERRKVCNQQPYVVKYTEWCFSIFSAFRCTKRRTEYRTVCNYEYVTVTSTVWECCEGYAQNGNICIPQCDQGCVHGVCVEPNQCSCEDGYRGEDCSSKCAEGFYGDCTIACNCENGAKCDPVNGDCICSSGFVGQQCEQPCEAWKHGADCLSNCLCVRDHTDTCSNINGLCTCKNGFKDPICATPCEQGATGSGCTQVCPCQNGGFCLHQQEGCNCTAGWFGDFCADKCPPDLWGPNCVEDCPQCRNEGECDRFTGECKCKPGFVGELCEQECEVGLWGDGCLNSCDCAFNVTCNPENGTCLCNEYQSGSKCENLTCPDGLFGPDCLYTCACQNNATCDVVTGYCDCSGTGYNGKHCNYAVCNPSCVHGICDKPDQCACEPGYGGDACDSVCPPGFYGDCTMPCTCENGADCEPVNGTCTCTPGYIGSKCNETCPDWTHGQNCTLDCQCIQNNTETCGNVNGECNCKSGYQGPLCSQRCPIGSTGSGCNETCPCQNNGSCLPEDAGCDCPSGWTGQVCAEPCDDSSWGANCAEQCPVCQNGASCDRFTGKCECTSGFFGEFCEKDCPVGLWGDGCENSCDCAFNVNCDNENGQCVCNQFQSGSRCEVLHCPANKYGPDCLHTCACQNGALCGVVDGSCTCTQPGFIGTFCSDACEYGKHGMLCEETCNCTSDLPFCDNVEGCISSERYYELYPPQSSQIGESEKQTSSANITWVGIAIATLVALVLVLALIAAMYFRLKAKKNMPRSPPPMYPERNGFVNPNFARSEDNLTYQDGRVSLAPNGDATYNAPYEQPPQYEDVVGDGDHQAAPLPPKVAPPPTPVPQAPAKTPQPTAAPRVNAPKDRQSEYHIYEHIEDETSPSQPRQPPTEDLDPSRIQLTVDNEYAHLGSQNPQSQDLPSQGSDPTKREQTNPFLDQQESPYADSHTYSSPSKIPGDEPIKRTYTGTDSLYGGGTEYSGYGNTPVDGNLKIPGAEAKEGPSASTTSGCSEHELRQESADAENLPN